MAVMTAQPPLPLVPDDACPVGAAAAIVEDDDGGRVFVHGNLAYAWDAGDTAARRFAAVSLMRIKAATQLEVAEAFAVKPATVRRWETRLTDAGLAGLLAERKGPKRKSKLTGDTVAAIRRLREDGASYRAIAAATGVSEGSVRNALTDTDTDTEEPGAPTGSDAHLPDGTAERGRARVEIEVSAEQDCPATISAAPVTDTGAAAAEAVVPVLADPAPRGGRARVGAVRADPGGSHRCSPGARGRRWRGCCWRCPRWRAPGCWTPRTPSTVSCRTGSTRWIRCCARACSAPCWARPARRARPGSTRSRWGGCWVWTGRRRSRRSAARSGCSPRPARPATGSPRWRVVVSRPAPSRRRCSTSTGMCAPTRAPAGSRKPMCRG